MTAAYFAAGLFDNIYLILVTKIIVAVGVYLGTLHLLGAAILRESIGYLFRRNGKQADA